MKNLLRLYPSLLVFLFLAGCGNNEEIEPDADDQPTTTTADFSATSCSDITMNGNYKVGEVLTDSNYFEVSVKVNKIGTYFFETEENNGMKFTAQGSFEETGNQTFLFKGEGTPEKEGEFNFQLEFANASCLQVVYTYERNFPNAQETFIINSGQRFFESSFKTIAHNADGTFLWQIEGLASVPVVDGDLAYMSINNSLQAIDIQTGESIWSSTSEFGISHEAVVGDANNIYVEGDGHLLAFAKSSGELIWQDSLSYSSRVPNNPTIADGFIYIAYSGFLYKYNTEGNRIWSYPTERETRSNVAVVDDVVYMGNDDGMLYAIDANDTSTLWTYNVQMTGEEGPTVVNGKVYIQGKEELFCLNASTGSILWTYPKGYSDTEWTTPTISNGVLFTTGFGDGLIALDAETGDFLWETGSSSPSTPPTVMGSLLIAQGANGMSAINAYNGKTLWGYGRLDALNPNQSVEFVRPAVIYDRKTGEVAYPGSSGMVQ